MSRENVEVIKRAHERLFGDLAGFRGVAADLAEFCHPEVHVDQTRRVTACYMTQPFTRQSRLAVAARVELAGLDAARR